jgi:DNA-binding transcriptional MerR regulator
MGDSDGMLQIGEVAERVGLSLRTVRYYEEMELLTPARRTEGGFRLYTEGEVERLDLIRQMKPLGFSVQEMRGLLDAYDTLRDPDADAGAIEVSRERLKVFAAEAAESCEKLRAQLERAQDFAKRLRREARRRPPAPART